MSDNSTEFMTNGTMDSAGEDKVTKPDSQNILEPEVAVLVDAKVASVTGELPLNPETLTESTGRAESPLPKVQEGDPAETKAVTETVDYLGTERNEEIRSTSEKLSQAETTGEEERENSEQTKVDVKTSEAEEPEASRAEVEVVSLGENSSKSGETLQESSGVDVGKEDDAEEAPAPEKLAEKATTGTEEPDKEERKEKVGEEETRSSMTNAMIENIINEEEKTLNDILKAVDDDSMETDSKEKAENLAASKEALKEGGNDSRDVPEESALPDSDDPKTNSRENSQNIPMTSTSESKSEKRDVNDEMLTERNDDDLDYDDSCSNVETKDSEISEDVKINRIPSPVSVAADKDEDMLDDAEIGNDDENDKPEVGIVGPPTAVSELINEEELRTESALPTEHRDNVQDHVAEWVQSAAAEGENEGKRETNVEEKSKRGKKGGDNTAAAPTRKSQRIVSNIIKRSIKCLNKMHAMDVGTGNGKGEKTTRVGGGSPNIPQSQQNGAALPEETAAAISQQANPVKKEPNSDTEVDPDILSEIQMRTETARSAVKTADSLATRKRRSTDDAQHANGNPKRACLEQREEFISALVGSDKISAQELAIRAEELRAELQALDQLARAKEKEWNEILSMRKLKEEAYLRIERRRQVVGFMEGNGPLGDAVLAPTNLSVSQDWEGGKDRSHSAPETHQKERNARPQQTISSSKQVENGQRESDVQNSENRQIGEGRQGPIVDVKSIIADYRLRHPETVPRRGRRGRRIRNSVNVDLGAGGAMVETGLTGDSRPSSTDSCKSNPNASVDPSSSMSFKDVLVQFAKLSQQQGEPVKTPQNYPDVTLHPVAPPPITQTAGSQQTGSLLHGILTKSQSPRPTTFSPTLARLLTAPERDRSSPVATSTPQQNPTTQHLLQTYQGSNPVSISDLLSSSKARTEITITPVVNAPVQSHSNNLIHVDEVEEEATVIEERGGRSASSARDDRDSPPRCQGCHDRAAQFVCAGCGNQWYCSRECQVSAWDEHSEVCSG